MTQTVSAKGNASGNASLGPQKIRAANKAWSGKVREDKRKARSARNAYREAIGLPPI